MTDIRIGETFRHFKGSRYLVTGFSMDVVGNKPVKNVLYMPIDKVTFDGIPCSRTVTNFLEEVDRRGNWGYQGPRFTRVTQDTAQKA